MPVSPRNHYPIQAFSDRLYELRRASGMTQRAFALRVGVDFTYISKLENGVMAPPATDTILRMTAALGTDSDHLLLLAGRLPADLKRLLVERPLLWGLVRVLGQLGDDDAREVMLHVGR